METNNKNKQMKEFNFKYMQVNTKFIIVDESYQRPCDFNRVAKIKKAFNPNLINVIKVSYRDGKYYCFDGQHTMMVLKELNDGNDKPVDCKVYSGMRREDEALLFAMQNGISRKPIKAQELRALYEAGDIDVVDWVDLVRSLGLKCTLESGGVGHNCVRCYSTMDKIFRRHGEIMLRTVLTTIMSAWNGDGESFNNNIMEGLCNFIDKYNGEYDEKYLVKKLSKVAPRTLINECMSRKTGGKYKTAIPFLEIYNMNSRVNRLEYKF